MSCSTKSNGRALPSTDSPDPTPPSWGGGRLVLSKKAQKERPHSFPGSTGLPMRQQLWLLVNAAAFLGGVVVGDRAEGPFYNAEGVMVIPGEFPGIRYNESLLIARPA